MAQKPEFCPKPWLRAKIVTSKAFWRASLMRLAHITFWTRIPTIANKSPNRTAYLLVQLNLNIAIRRAIGCINKRYQPLFNISKHLRGKWLTGLPPIPFCAMTLQSD